MAQDPALLAVTVADESDVESRLAALHDKDIETTIELEGLKEELGEANKALAVTSAHVADLTLITQRQAAELAAQSERIALLAAGDNQSFWRDLLARYTSRRFLVTAGAMFYAGLMAFAGFAAPVAVWTPATVAMAVGTVVAAVLAAIGYNVTEGGVDKERAKALARPPIVIERESGTPLANAQTARS